MRDFTSMEHGPDYYSEIIAPDYQRGNVVRCLTSLRRLLINAFIWFQEISFKKTNKICYRPYSILLPLFQKFNLVPILNGLHA